MRSVALTLFGVCLVACGGSPTGPAALRSTATATITAVRITPNTTTLKVGATEQFSVTETMGTGIPPSGPPPVWTVADRSVAIVSSTGQVTAVSPGRTTLTVIFFGNTDLRTLDVVR
jgi:uncharacterized protein YjdB